MNLEMRVTLGSASSIAILVCSLLMAVGHLDLDARRANSFRMTASNLALVVGSVLSLQALILEAVTSRLLLDFVFGICLSLALSGRDQQLDWPMDRKFVGVMSCGAGNETHFDDDAALHIN